MKLLKHILLSQTPEPELKLPELKDEFPDTKFDLEFPELDTAPGDLDEPTCIWQASQFL